MVAIPSMGYTIERIMTEPSRSGIFLPTETIDEIAADAHDTAQAQYMFSRQEHETREASLVLGKRNKCSFQRPAMSLSYKALCTSKLLVKQLNFHLVKAQFCTHIRRRV